MGGGGAYTWSNTSVKEKVALSVGNTVFGTKFCFRQTRTMPLFKISVQLTVEPLIVHLVCSFQHV